MKIYVDIGNSNIKYKYKNILEIKAISNINFINLVNKYYNYDWIIIITNRNKDKFINILKEKKINFKLVSCDDVLFKNIVDSKINISEVGIDILLASMYLYNNTGVVIINGTALISVFIKDSIIKSISIGLGLSQQNKQLNYILKLKNQYNIANINGDNTFNSICLSNFFNIFGIINYYQTFFGINRFILSGNGFKDLDLKDLNKIANIEYVDNLVLRMLEKSF